MGKDSRVVRTDVLVIGAGAAGIRAAIEAKPEKKRGKRETAYLEQWERLMLAKSLKSMDVIPDIPMPRMVRPLTEAALREYFVEFGFASILREVPRLI